MLSSIPNSSLKDTGSHPSALTHMSNHSPLSKGLEEKNTRALGSKRSFSVTVEGALGLIMVVASAHCPEWEWESVDSAAYGGVPCAPHSPNVIP